MLRLLLFPCYPWSYISYLYSKPYPPCAISCLTLSFSETAAKATVVTVYCVQRFKVN